MFGLAPLPTLDSEEASGQFIATMDRSDVSSRVLCHQEEIEDGAAKGFYWRAASAVHSVFVVRAGAQFFGYVNACPHLGTPLEFLPDQFTTEDGSHILCSTHGAQFRIADGFCVSGPCKGERLRPASLQVDAEGHVVLLDLAY